MHGQVVSCHPLVWLDSQLAMSERGIWDATQIERQRNEHSQAAGDGKNVCEPRVVVIACVAGEERNERSEGEGVCLLDGGSARGRERESSQGLRSLQYTAPKRETHLTPCTRASRLRDASVQKESCRHQWHSRRDYKVQAFAHLSDVRGRFRQSSWSEDDLLISGRSLRPSPHLDVRTWLKDSLRGRMPRKSDTGTRAVCVVSVHPPTK